MQFGAEQVLAFTDLFERAGELCQRIPESLQRDLLLGVLSKLRVYDGPKGLRIESKRTDVSDILHAP